MTKFVHIRQHDVFTGTVMPTGGITVAYNFDPETRVATYLDARCANHDHYNKKIGRKVTEGRLAKYGGTKVEVPEGLSVADRVVRHLLENKYGVEGL